MFFALVRESGTNYKESHGNFYHIGSTNPMHIKKI